MDERHSLSPGHILIAVIFAAGVAWGGRAWLSHRATQSAQSATLSYDATAARQIDPRIDNAAEPAVAMAQSILSDEVVAGLAQSASSTLFARQARIGEFRSRLKLHETSGRLLQVQFRDADAGRSARIANAVARVLSTWTSALAAPSAETAAPQPQVQPATTVKNPAAGPAHEANDALSTSLGELDAQLSATRVKVDSFNSRAPGTPSGEPPSYREARQQQLLTSAVKAGQETLEHLRAEHAGDSRAAAGVSDSLTRMQQALSSVWPGSRSSRYSAADPGFNAAGVDASRLRRERTQFNVAIDVVERERRAIAKLESAQSSSTASTAPPSSTPAPSAPASPPAVQPASASPQPSAIVPQSAGQPVRNPLQLLRPANPTGGRFPLWPAVVAGLGCGLLYLALAAALSRRGEDEEDYSILTPADSQRLITPSEPVQSAGWLERAPEDSSQQMRTAPDISLANEDDSGGGSHEPSVLTADEKKPLFVEDPAGSADPWLDQMKKTLSETSFGKMFEEPARRNREAEPEPETESEHHPVQPNRRTG